MLRTAARACFDAALASVDPRRLVGEALRREGGALRLETAAGVRSHRGPVLLVAAGKPALGMAQGAAAAQPIAGVVVVPHGVPGDGPAGTVVLHAAHPVPDDAGLHATARLLDAVRTAGPETLVLVLLGGGASSLLVAPAGGRHARRQAGGDRRAPRVRCRHRRPQHGPQALLSHQGRRPGARRARRGRRVDAAALGRRRRRPGDHRVGSDRRRSRPPSPMRAPSSRAGSRRDAVPERHTRPPRRRPRRARRGIGEARRPGARTRRDPGPRRQSHGRGCGGRGGPPARVTSRTSSGRSCATTRKAPRGESSPRSTSRPVTGRSPSWQAARRRCGSCAAGAAGDRSTWRSPLHWRSWGARAIVLAAGTDGIDGSDRRRGRLRRRRDRRPGARARIRRRRRRSPRPTATRCWPRPAISCAPGPRARTSPTWWSRSGLRASPARRCPRRRRTCPSCSCPSRARALHAGRRQLFVRFAGCPLRCRYCDTPESLVPVAECRILGVDGVRVRPNPLTVADARRRGARAARRVAAAARRRRHRRRAARAGRTSSSRGSRGAVGRPAGAARDGRHPAGAARARAAVRRDREPRLQVSEQHRRAGALGRARGVSALAVGGGPRRLREDAGRRRRPRQRRSSAARASRPAPGPVRPLFLTPLTGVEGSALQIDAATPRAPARAGEPSPPRRARAAPAAQGARHPVTPPPSPAIFPSS